MHVSGPTLSPERLQSCLDQLGPVDLLGLALLAQCQPTTSWLPGSASNVPTKKLTQATVQLIEYGEHCREAAERLTALRPVPIALEIPEYGL